MGTFSRRMYSLLNIRASRHSGSVRREPDGPRAAGSDAENAGSGGTGGPNHLGLHRNASGRVEFPPSAVPCFCRRNIPEGSDQAGLDHAGGEIALLAPSCDLSERRGRGIGLDGQHLDQRPPDLDDGQPTMEGFATAALRVDRLHPHVDHALAPFQGGKHGLNRPAKRNDHVFGCMTRISGQQKPFRFPFAIDEHRDPNGSDRTTAEEAGPADGGAIANGGVAAVDRQFRVRLPKRLELRLRDAVAVLAGPSWFSRWRRLIQGSVAWPMTMASRVRTSPIRYPFMDQASSSSVIAPRLVLTSTRARIVSSLPWLPRQVRHQRHAPGSPGIADHRRQADHRLGQDIVGPIGLVGVIVLDRGARRRLGHARDQGIVADHDAALGWELPLHDPAQGMDHGLPVELALANHPIVAGPVPPAWNRQNRLADRAIAGQQGAGQQFQDRDGTAPRERGDDLGDPQAEYRRDANNRSCNHAALRGRGSAPVEVGLFAPAKTKERARRGPRRPAYRGCRDARMSSLVLSQYRNAMFRQS